MSLQLSAVDPMPKIQWLRSTQETWLSRSNSQDEGLLKEPWLRVTLCGKLNPAHVLWMPHFQFVQSQSRWAFGAILCYYLASTLTSKWWQFIMLVKRNNKMNGLTILCGTSVHLLSNPQRCRLHLPSVHNTITANEQSQQKKEVKMIPDTNWNPQYWRR